VKKGHKNMYEVKGNLTIKGVTHEVIFLMEDNGIIEYDGRKYGALKVTSQLKKSDFKIYGGGDRLGDIINITAYFETVKVEN
jgi:polyisoprenoid-binding protein YceI